MTISNTNLVDDNFKVINKITGARNEDEIQLDSPEDPGHEESQPTT